MTDAVQVFDAGYRVLNANGTPVSGAKIKFYDAGTTNPKTVYSDASLSTSLGSVVYTRSDGFPVASSGSNTTVLIFTGTADYKIEITDSSDVAIFPSKDNVKGAIDTSSFLTSGDTSILDLPVLQTSSTTYALTSARNGRVIVGNTSGGSISMTLDSAVTLGDGWNVEVRKSSASNSLTISTTGGQFINETETSFTLTDKNDFVQIRCDGTQFFATAYRIPVTRDGPRGHISGFIMSNNASDTTNDIDITAGRARSDDDTLDIPVGAMTKRLDAAWSAGTGNGFLDTGSIANTLYHVFAIYNPTTSTGDFLASTSLASPTMPSGYTKKRRIGTIFRSSGSILGFVQIGDRFYFNTPINETVGTGFDTTQRNYTLTVPTGVEVVADVSVFFYSSGGVVSFVTGHPTASLAAPGTASSVPSNPVVEISRTTGEFGISRHMVPTNTSAQIAVRASASGTGSDIFTFGYIDNRGKG